MQTEFRKNLSDNNSFLKCFFNVLRFRSFAILSSKKYLKNVEFAILVIEILAIL